MARLGYSPEEARSVLSKVMTYGLSRLQKKDRADVLLALHLAKRLRHKNPPGKNSPVRIYGQTEKIFMKKTQGPYKGQRFVHDFKGGVTQTGLPRGTVITFPDGKSVRCTTRAVILDGKKDLWRNFPA